MARCSVPPWVLLPVPVLYADGLMLQLCMPCRCPGDTGSAVSACVWEETMLLLAPVWRQKGRIEQIYRMQTSAAVGIS